MVEGSRGDRRREPHRPSEERELAASKLFAIDPASEPEADYLQSQAVNGRRLGGIKRPHFDRTAGRSRVFKKDGGSLP